MKSYVGRKVQKMHCLNYPNDERPILTVRKMLDRDLNGTDDINKCAFFKFVETDTIGWTAMYEILPE